MATFGFIGTGNMGGALATAVARSVSGERLVLSNRTREKADALAGKLGCVSADTARAAECDFVFLGVKPQMMESLMEQLAPILQRRKTPFVLVSMAAGLTIRRIQALAGGAYPVIRIMPNTAVEVGCGIVLYECSDSVTPAQTKDFLQALGKAGLLDRLPEAQMDAGTAVAGCGPAFVYAFMEALAQGGENCGLPAQTAMAYAKQMILGAAKLAQESPLPPQDLRKAVCSPGGSTIEGIKALEAGSFSRTVAEAVNHSYRRNQELGK